MTESTIPANVNDAPGALPKTVVVEDACKSTVHTPIQTFGVTQSVSFPKVYNSKIHLI